MNEIIANLRTLRNEEGVNKNIKSKIDIIIKHLESDPVMGKDKALSEFEDLIDENNIESHIRTEIYSIVSMLESL